MGALLRMDKFWSNAPMHRILLVCIAFLLYANTLNHEYTQDDAIVIYDNMFTTKGVSGFSGILTNDTFYGFFKEEGKAKLVSGGRYRPLTLLMFALEWQIFGNNPFIGHLFNLLYFALLVLILYELLALLFKQKMDVQKRYLLSFIAALIFAVHPIHTEVIANIKGRDEIISLLFSLLTFWFVLKAIDRNKIILMLPGMVFFLLGMLSKENAITFLAVIPLGVFLFRDISIKKNLFLTSGLLISAIVFLLIRTNVLGLDFGGKSLELMNNPFLKIEGSKYVDFSFQEKISTIIFTLGKYIQLLLFPHPLTHDYYPRQISIMSFSDWRVMLSFMAYLGMVIFGFVKMKKFPVIAFGIFFFIMTISIVSNILFPIGTNMSERFIFMPSVGFALIAAWLLIQLKEKRSWLFSFILITVITLFSAKTFTRNMVWKNDFTLFTTDVKTSGNSAKVLNAAGGSLVTEAIREQNPQKQEKMLREAVGYLKRAIEIHPNYKNAYLILGNAQFYLKQYVDAIQSFERTLTIDPNFKDARNNLAICYREAGKYYGQEKNDIPNALLYLEKAYQEMPNDYETVRLMGIAYAYSGNNEKALEYFLKGTKLEPSNAGAFVNLGNIYYNIGDPEQGKLFHIQALELDADIFSEKK